MSSLVFFCASLVVSSVAATDAPVRPFVLAVGVNDAGVPGLAPLAYADDDAVEAVRLFAGDAHERVRLLAVMDQETQAQARDLARIARVPSSIELSRAVAELVVAIEAAREAGESPIVHLWLSGHASYDDDGHAMFPLLDGPLSAQRFIDDVVRPLARAHRVHLFIDTCFATALVRAKAAVTSVEPALAEATFFTRGLAGLPNVGAFVAASSASAAYEWEEVRAGVFSALTRAGLRGAADADGDDAVRYSELGAFLAASTDAVAVAPARPKIALYPPALDEDAVVHETRGDERVALFDDDISHMGPVSIVDERGAFLLAATFEPGFRPRLWLPRERELFLRARGEEHPLVHDGERLKVGDARPTDVRARSLVSRALEEGLFKTPYGPAFYRGYRVTTVKRVSGAVDEKADAPVTRSLVAPFVFFGLASTAGVVTLAAGAASALFAAQLLTTTTERRAYESFAGASFAGGVAAGALVVCAVTTVGGVTWIALDE